MIKIDSCRGPGGIPEACGDIVMLNKIQEADPESRFQRSGGAYFRDALTAAAVLVLVGLVTLSAGPACATDLVSTNYRLRGGHFNGGGLGDMGSTAAMPTIGVAGGSIAQSEPLGFSGKTVDLTTLAPGFWPIVMGGFPSLDLDGDVIQAFRDNCPYAYNPPQTDSGGIGLGSPADGIGDVCQCGDVTDDGMVDDLDILAFRTALTDPNGAPLSPGGQSKCTVIGVSSLCDDLDVTVIRRDIEGPTLPPHIQQVCAATKP